MASSVYYQNDANYWSHHQASVGYQSAHQDYVNCYQQPQQHHAYSSAAVVTAAVNTTQQQQQQQPSSLLETLLRHGKEAINESYASQAVKLSGSPPNQQASQPSQHVSCHTPPYTPTSSERNSPGMCGVQDQQVGFVAPPTESYPPHSYPPSSHYQNPYQSAAVKSPVSYVEGIQANCLYDNNNKSPKKEFLDDAGQMVDFAWMKSSGSSGE